MGSSYQEFGSSHPGILLWRQAVDGPHEQLVIPDGAADVIVASDGTAVLVGPTERPERVPLPAGSRLSGLRFRPGVVGSALGVSAAELRGRTVPLADVVPRALAERLRAVTTGRLAVDRLELPAEDRVGAAVRLLCRGLSVDQVVAATAVSSRQLRRSFLTTAGLGPKAMQRVLRLQRFLRLAERPGASDLAGLAIRSGYADQAHLSREVRTLTSRTPGQLLRERAHVSETFKPSD